MLMAFPQLLFPFLEVLETKHASAFECVVVTKGFACHHIDILNNRGKKRTTVTLPEINAKVPASESTAALVHAEPPLLQRGIEFMPSIEMRCYGNDGAHRGPGPGRLAQDATDQIRFQLFMQFLNKSTKTTLSIINKNKCLPVVAILSPTSCLLFLMFLLF